ncbi:MAG TPA: TIGR00303 family protein [Methanomassiliicoccaceae archaeon]|nr:TIGR00303 family protein [Methanomassiliicoccaceae archaeon]
MAFKVPDDITLCLNEDRGREFLERIWNKKAAYCCVIGNTETAKIPGVSAAGADPAATDFTPAADMELLYFGRCKCIDGVPITPSGIPTPGIITMSALKLAPMPIFVVNGGVRVRPHVPCIDVDGTAGDDIRTGKAVKGAEQAYDRALVAGRQLAKMVDYLVVGESIPGGTTTALGVLTALGYDASGKVASTFPVNPHELKAQVVAEGIAASGLSPEALKNDAMAAVQAVGDPMMAPAAGLIAGAAESIPVLMAGGTQMAAVLAIIRSMDDTVLDNLALGTTRWITEDKTSDLRGIVSQIGNVPVMAANLNFSLSRYDGLQVYETGLVKEGVGAGGSAIAAMAATGGKVTCRSLLDEIEKNYTRLVSRR